MASPVKLSDYDDYEPQKPYDGYEDIEVSNRFIHQEFMHAFYYDNYTFFRSK